jgi:thiamine biosynthesis lipoprotein
METNNPFLSSNGDIDRRSFMRISGLLGLGLATASFLPATAEAVKFNRKNYKVSKTRLAMGTFVSMTLVHPSKDQAEKAMGLAFEEIDRLTRTMSRFDQTTAVAHLNREGLIKDVPPEMAFVLSKAINYYRLSNGTFDVTVKPLVDLFRKKFAQGDGSPPAEKDILKSMELVGSHNISVKGSSVSFKTPGMGITLDGIAKGYIVDRVSDVLSGLEIRNFLINAGGDIRTKGKRQDKKPWTVAIQDPRKGGKYPDILQMTDGAIATSGNYEIYFDREKMFHHIVDPTKGMSPQLSSSVSVLSKTAMDADALSTAVFVMGPSRGTRFLDNHPGREGLIIGKEGRKFKSSGWKGTVS